MRDYQLWHKCFSFGVVQFGKIDGGILRYIYESSYFYDK